MKRILMTSGIAFLALATIVSAQAYTFNSNLTVGSRGQDVVALQTWLINNGFSISAGATGYFGSQTKAAVQAFQTKNSVPPTGFVGPLTRGVLNQGGGMATGGTTNTTCPAGYTCTVTNPVTTVTCPTGFTCTANPGTTGTVVGGSTGITTPGVPGIISVTAAPLSTTVMNVGAQMVPVIGVRVQAQYSDVAIQSLQVDLGNNTSVYNKIFNKIYVTDGTNVLASQPLNSSTVVQSGSNYVVGLAGFNVVVPKGTFKDIIVKADLNSSIDSAYLASGANYPTSGTLLTGITAGWGIGIDANTIRAVDGAGVNLYGPSTAYAQSLTINKSLVDNAQANISLESSSPQVANIPVSDTTNNQYLSLPVLVFNVNAQNDTLHIREVKVHLSNNGGTGTLTAAYLFQGSTQIMSAPVSGDVADFNNIVNGTNGASIPVNTTLPYTVKVDVTGVTSAAAPLSLTASTTASDMTIYNSIDGSATVTGGATGYKQTVASVGPLFTLNGAPTLTVSASPVSYDGANQAGPVYKYTATYNINVTAVGTDVMLGLNSSTTNANAAAFGTSTTGINVAEAFVFGTASTSINLAAGYSAPAGTAVSSDNNSFTIARNQTVTIPVTYTFLSHNPGSAQFNVQLQSINWALGPTTFMANQQAWRTNAQ